MARVQIAWMGQLQSAQDKYHEDSELRMRNRLASLGNDDAQLTSYLQVMWHSQSSTPPLLHLPVASRRSATPSTVSPAASRDPSPSVSTHRDRSPSAGSVPSSPYLVVSAAVDEPTTDGQLAAPPLSAWDSSTASDASTTGEKQQQQHQQQQQQQQQRPASLYARRRTVLKAIREKSLSIDVEKLDMQRPPSSTSDAIVPRS